MLITACAADKQQLKRAKQWRRELLETADFEAAGADDDDDDQRADTSAKTITKIER